MILQRTQVYLCNLEGDLNTCSIIKLGWGWKETMKKQDGKERIKEEVHIILRQDFTEIQSRVSLKRKQDF